MSESDRQTGSYERSRYGLPFEQALLLEQACDRFENEWGKGGRPDILAAVIGLPEKVRSAGLRELVVLDIYHRRKLGETPATGDYATRFSELGPDWLVAVVNRVDPDGESLTPTVVQGVGLPPGTRIGDYELLHEIARGGMGVVYRARQVSLPRFVAIKILLRAGASHRERFRLEAEAMARLHHPHIANIIEVSRDDGLPFLSMDWYPGGTLAGRVARSIQDIDRTAKQLVQIAGAVHHAHQRGILHLDLKPLNILLDEFGELRVADFGLAISVARSIDEKAAISGTLEYMAPEQLSGDVTVSTDVYGLGAILYDLLTGRAPSAADSLEGKLERVRAAAPDVPHIINPLVDPDLEAICLKCMAKDPNLRYESAEAVAEDLERFLAGDPVWARPLGVIGLTVHALSKARSAVEFRRAAPLLAAQAVVVFLNNSVAYMLLQVGAAEPLIWLAIFASYLPLLAIGLRGLWRAPARSRPCVRHLWAVGLGHAAAAVAGFVAHRVLVGDDPIQWMGGGYITCAAVNASLFVVLGSLFAGRLYLLGMIWVGAAVAMAGLLPWAPLIYAGLIASSSALTASLLRGLAVHEASSPPVSERTTSCHPTSTMENRP